MVKRIKKLKIKVKFFFIIQIYKPFGFIEVNKERIVYKAIDVSGIIFDQMTISKKNNEN